jgi:hypothetical protein
MKSIVAEFGSGFALLPRDVLDGELIESPFHIAKTHGSFVLFQGIKLEADDGRMSNEELKAFLPRNNARRGSSRL